MESELQAGGELENLDGRNWLMAWWEMTDDPRPLRQISSPRSVLLVLVALLDTVVRDLIEGVDGTSLWRVLGALCILCAGAWFLLEVR
eukprot:scaffold52336_cov17-Prasinocladus_malaysianus.AAC.1